MTAVFADTHYFLALLNPRDQWHAKAVAFTKGFSGKMLTTAWVLTELADALASTPKGRAEFLSTRDDLRADPDARSFPVTRL